MKVVGRAAGLARAASVAGVARFAGVARVERVARAMVLCVLAIAIVALVPARAEAQLASCSLSASTVAFGNCNPLAIVALDTTGTVNFSCNAFALLPRLTLSRGSSSTFAPRTMLGPGGGVLNYNLYLDPVHLLVWGDGTGGTSQFIAIGLVGQVTFFGSIPASQDALAGAYSDALTVTIIF